MLSTTPILLTWVLVISPTLSRVDSYSSARKRQLREKVRKMFYLAYENYLTHAFPHDELKPLSKSFTDSLSELGNLKCGIRVLGGLVSAHILAIDSANRLVQGSYKNQLLTLAEDLGCRFLPAFNTPTGLPYAWINLKES
ncbi:hypothetical protein Ddye_002391 [Dipteronia dyeriana]|uniref:Alpha-1,2-Mannosidase n=1 Tax=Dipteronia dyeriana TaxID=168575 RepID=A0AAD9XQV4_9ROSI|nr:hypothetical protein Ddye_002391 [Dipteronia dyeriana]